MSPNPGEFRGPKTLQSNCISYNNVAYTKINLNYTGGGTFNWQIGTSTTPIGSITWQSITANVNITLTNPNKAIFYRVGGSNRATLTYIEIELTR